MTDDDVYYIGNLMLNGMGDGQSPQLLSLVPMHQRVLAPNFARMQIGEVEIVRNFVAQQIRAISNRRLMQLNDDEDNADDYSQRIGSQRRSRSELQLRETIGGLGRRVIVGAVRRGFRIGIRRSILRTRVRSLSPTSSIILQTATSSQQHSMHE